MTLHESVIDNLLLVALLAQKKKPDTIRRVTAQPALLKLLSPKGGAKETYVAASASANRLLEQDLVRPTGDEAERVVLSPAGRKGAWDYLGYKTLSTPVQWGQKGPHVSLCYGYLPAKALGLAGKLDKPALKRLATVDGLRAELIRQRFQLNLRPVPAIEDVRAELAWKLLEDGANAETIRHGRGRLKAFNSVELVADILMFSRAQCPRVKKGTGHVALANVLAGLDATDGSADALYRAVLRPLLEVGPLEGARPHRRPQKSGTTPRQPTAPARAANGTQKAPDDFAQRALRAARKSETGRVGDSLVLISHAWRNLHRGGEAISLSDFKRRLIEAYDRDQLTLAKYSAPQVPPQRALARERPVPG